MRYALIILSLSSTKPPEVLYFSNSAINSYEKIVEQIPSYESTGIKVIPIGEYNSYIVIREDHPLFNIGMVYNIIKDHRISPLFNQSVSLMRDIYNRVI